jgi:hypothetical protein
MTLGEPYVKVRQFFAGPMWVIADLPEFLSGVVLTIASAG